MKQDELLLLDQLFVYEEVSTTLGKNGKVCELRCDKISEYIVGKATLSCTRQISGVIC